MAIKRYNKRKTIFDDSELIQKILDNKNISGIRHYMSPNFKIPTYTERNNIQTITVVWKLGDRLSKYAEKYYSNSELWWIIGMYNKKPTDAHFKVGDYVYIPTNLADLVNYIEV